MRGLVQNHLSCHIRGKKQHLAVDTDVAGLRADAPGAFAVVDGDLTRCRAHLAANLTGKNRNQLLGITNFSEKSGALKFLLTGFKKSENDFFIYANLQLHQRAYLAINHEYMDCQTWDTWKMGIFNMNEIFLEVEDMAREFANDFISANSF